MVTGSTRTPHGPGVPRAPVLPHPLQRLLVGGSLRTTTRPTLNGRKPIIGPRARVHSTVWILQYFTTNRVTYVVTSIHPEV